MQLGNKGNKALRLGKAIGGDIELGPGVDTRADMVVRYEKLRTWCA